MKRQGLGDRRKKGCAAGIWGGEPTFAKAANGLVRDAIADIRSGNGCVPQTQPPEETV